MDKPELPRGNFSMNLNFKRNGNAKAPPITGRISTPEAPETQYAYSAFKHLDDNGRPYWIGPVETSTSLRHALNTAPERGTNFVAIRENGFRVFKELDDGSPNPAYAKLADAEKQHEDSKPAFWATWTRTPNDPQLIASAWDRDANRYGPWASGNTQHPMTKEQVAAMGRIAETEMLTSPEPVKVPRAPKPRPADRDQNRV
jgi:hypothetical protein